ncbi:MAG: hypothetical protein ACFCVK_06790 [Acidimicrobiales bacterium]
MGYGGTLYNIFLIAHLITAITAFGPLFVYPALRRAGESQAVAQLHMRIVFPSLTLLWVLGMGLAGLSDDVIKVSHLWVTLSVVLWVGLMAVSWFLIRPSLVGGGERQTSMLGAGVGITHLGLVIGLYLMVFQPDFGG